MKIDWFQTETFNYYFKKSISNLQIIEFSQSDQLIMEVNNFLVNLIIIL